MFNGELVIPRVDEPLNERKLSRRCSPAARLELFLAAVSEVVGQSRPSIVLTSKAGLPVRQAGNASFADAINQMEEVQWDS
jgi:hypothetical protein